MMYSSQFQCKNLLLKRYIQGFPAFPCLGASEIFSEGDAELDVRGGKVTNVTTGETIFGKKYPP